jgi:hypothetical protein
MAKPFAGNNLEPDHGFAQFFQGELHLINQNSTIINRQSSIRCGDGIRRSPNLEPFEALGLSCLE